MSAFKAYLKGQKIEEAALHIIECLKNGGPGNQAWELMEECYGSDWKCPPNHLVSLAVAAIYLLRKQTDETNEQDEE